MSQLSGIVTSTLGPVSGKAVHVFDLGNNYVASAVMTGAAYVVTAPDGSVRAYVEGGDTGLFPSQWVGGDTFASADVIVIAGPTVRDLLILAAGQDRPGAIRTWTDAATILARSGASASPSPEDTEWAEACADAVNAGMDDVLTGATVTGTEPELLWLASMAGIEAYKRREAVFGITGYVDLQGAAIRVARDYLEAQRPLLGRYATVGIA